MRLIALLVIVGGWAIAMSGLFLTTASTTRILFALVGICVSLFGILGVLNQYYLSRAIWKK